MDNGTNSHGLKMIDLCKSTSVTAHSQWAFT